MGPPFLNGGNRDDFICTAVLEEPSMGPPFLNGGNPHPPGGGGGRDPPSMGPPFLNGGNRKDSKRPQLGSISFNGAAVSQRRKRYRLDINSGAPTRLQWGRRFSTAETSQVETETMPDHVPSMGPPFLNGGNRHSAHTSCG